MSAASVGALPGQDAQAAGTAGARQRLRSCLASTKTRTKYHALAAELWCQHHCNGRVFVSCEWRNDRRHRSRVATAERSTLGKGRFADASELGRASRRGQCRDKALHARCTNSPSHRLVGRATKPGLRKGRRVTRATPSWVDDDGAQRRVSDVG